MAASSSTVQPSEPESFTAMDKDLDAIGAHCQYQYCRQLDFLPFRCESCKEMFCLEHRTETAHKCSHAGAWAAARRAQNQKAAGGISSLPPQRPTLETATQCSHPKCKTFINTFQSTGVHCSRCNREYCLKHRMEEDHDCKDLIPIGARPFNAKLNAQAQTEKAKMMFSKLKLWGKEKQEALSRPKKNHRVSTAVAIAQLKKMAKGDAKIPVDKRIYLHVEAEASTTSSKFPKGECFFNKDWSVGRVLDAAAKQLQVQNINNRVESEDQRLRVFHIEAGRLLEFSEKIGQVCVDANTIVLLRGVGTALQDLIEL